MPNTAEQHREPLKIKKGFFFFNMYNNLAECYLQQVRKTYITLVPYGFTYTPFRDTFFFPPS
jgi:hypothetical protein